MPIKTNAKNLINVKIDTINSDLFFAIDFTLLDNLLAYVSSPTEVTTPLHEPTITVEPDNNVSPLAFLIKSASPVSKDSSISILPSKIEISHRT